MSLKINKNELNVKNKIVDDAIVQLKKEFVGIDEQIDIIMSNVRVWYLWPQLQSSPCVINVFGMTGCGKTSLVRRIAQLLDREKDLVYFNFSAINEMNCWEVECDIEDQLDNECSDRIFVYDEFQYAASINEDGNEKENKNGLKPFWELLDTGILHKRYAMYDMKKLNNIIRYMAKINSMCPIELKNGVWVNSSQCFEFLSDYDKDVVSDLFCCESVAPPVHGLGKNNYTERMELDDEKGNFFLSNYSLEVITKLYNRAFSVVMETYELHDKLCHMNSTEIYNLLEEIYRSAKKGYKLKFNNSLIFVIANVDEAYDVAFSINPDMSPDQFYKQTKKISIVDIKKALQKRFRNEQIARLGNIHIIYPSFSSESFKKIIESNLEAYRKTAKELCGLEFEFDSSIKNAIYDESVYPTHGTRPIFSTIHEMIKTKLPHIIRNVCDDKKDDDAELIRYSYKGKKSLIEVFNKERNVICSYKFSNKLRLSDLRSSTSDEHQAATAVHESGHFVVYSYLNGKIPEKLVSRSAEKDMNGFMMHDINEEEKKVWSRIDYLNEIKVCLGGYVAEGVIFGNDRRSSGASSDLSNATKIASKMVRKLGLLDIAYITTYMCGGIDEDLLVKEDNQDYINKKIKKIIEVCLEETTEIINKPHIMKMLKSSSKYLFSHSQMPKHMMEKMLKTARSEGEMCDRTDSYYRDIVRSF